MKIKNIVTVKEAFKVEDFIKIDHYLFEVTKVNKSSVMALNIIDDEDRAFGGPIKLGLNDLKKARILKRVTRGVKNILA
jgi:hypothetical protein